MNKAVIYLLCLLFACSTPEDNKLNKLLPQPVSIEKLDGEFVLSRELTVACDSQFLQAEDFLLSAMELLPQVSVTKTAGKFISIKKSQANNLGEEGYIVDIQKDKIIITASGYGGAFYGVQTLLQLISMEPKTIIPCGKITDRPKYAWRGFMLDVARGFHPPEELKKMIDLLAFYKVNTFQLHLTDDQGWRMEIKSKPKLTEIGSKHPPIDSLSGGYYTQEEMKEIIEYARVRNIQVIPELDIPGHSRAAIAAYPGLSCFGEKVEVRSHAEKFVNPIDSTGFTDPMCLGKESTYVFLDSVIRELAEIFPAEIIHFGGDECSKGAWKKCKHCQHLKKELGVETELKVQGHFMNRVEEIAKKYGKTAMGWDEVYEARVSKDYHIMAWRDEIWGVDAANDGYQVVMGPSQYYYLSRPQEEYKERHWGVLTPLRYMFSYRPPYHKIDEEKRQNVYGLHACFWGNAEWDDIMYNMFPRFIVFADHAWSAKEMDINGFMRKMGSHYNMLDEKEVNYYIEHPLGLHNDLCLTDEYEVNLWTLIPDAEIRYTLDGSEPTLQSELFTAPFTVHLGAKIKAKTYLPNGRSSITVDGASKKADLMPAVDPGDVRPGLQLSVRKGIVKSTVDMETLPEIHNQTIEKIRYPDDSLRHDFALSFTGYLKIPKDGVYSIYTSSCDGSNVYINDSLVVSNDFTHPKLTIYQRVALAKGYHKFRYNYFHNSLFEKYMSMEIEGPGIERKGVSGEILFH